MLIAVRDCVRCAVCGVWLSSIQILAVCAVCVAERLAVYGSAEERVAVCSCPVVCAAVQRCGSVRQSGSEHICK
jgi:hypothetical protein